MQPSPSNKLASKKTTKNTTKQSLRRITFQKHMNKFRSESLSKYGAVHSFPKWCQKDVVTGRHKNPSVYFVPDNQNREGSSSSSMKDRQKQKTIQSATQKKGCDSLAKNKKQNQSQVNDRPTYTTDLWGRKKFDVLHMKASKLVNSRKYIMEPKPGEVKPAPKDLKKLLQDEAEKLSVPMLQKSTVTCHTSLIKRYDTLMESLGEDKEPTPHRAILFFSWMKCEGYSVRYICKGLMCLKYHPQLSSNYFNISRHPDMRNALSNLRKMMLQPKDSRIPLTKEIAMEFEKIADKDFSKNAALAMKTGIWLGLTCMLRIRELVTSSMVDDEFSHTVPYDLMLFDKKKVTVTFDGWKTLHHRRTLSFDYLKGTEEKMFSLLTSYGQFRKKTARDYVKGFMVNKDGTAMSRHSFEVMWHHMVDHSRWKGLNLTGHSMRIGGSTCRHKEGKEMRQIMWLGRWKDDTINKYLRPELKMSPQSLRRIGLFQSKREECHLLCSCPAATDPKV